MGGKSSKTKVTQRLDPSQVALNNLALQLAQEQAPYRQAALQGPIAGAITPNTSISPQALQGLNLASTEQPYTSLKYASPYSAAAAGSLLGLTDMSKLTGAATDYYNKIVAPGALASLTASGLGRSGAVGETAAKYGAQIALPLEQQRESNVANLANWVTGQQAQQLQISQGLQTGSPTFGGGGSTTTQQSQPFNWGGAIGSGLSLLGNSSAMSGLSSLGGGLASIGSGIWGGISSLGAGIAGLFSSREFKEGIQPLTRDDILDMVDKTPIYRWRYKGSTRLHTGPITEESPKLIVSDDGKMLDLIDYNGFLFAGLKALNRKVDSLSRLSPQAL